MQKLFYGGIVNEKLHLTQKLLILEYFVIKNIKHFRTTLEQFLDVPSVLPRCYFPDQQRFWHFYFSGYTTSQM